MGGGIESPGACLSSNLGRGDPEDSRGLSMVVEGAGLPDLGASLATGVDTRVSGVGGSEACPGPAEGRVPNREVPVSDCGT